MDVTDELNLWGKSGYFKKISMSIPPKVLSSTKTKTLFLCFHEIQIRHHDITKNLVFAVILACNVERTTSLSLTPFHDISHWPQIGSKDHQHLSHNADIYSWTTLGSLLHIPQFLIWHRIGLVFVQLPALEHSVIRAWVILQSEQKPAGGQKCC